MKYISWQFVEWINIIPDIDCCHIFSGIFDYDLYCFKNISETTIFSFNTFQNFCTFFFLLELMTTISLTSELLSKKSEHFTSLGVSFLPWPGWNFPKKVVSIRLSEKKCRDLCFDKVKNSSTKYSSKLTEFLSADVIDSKYFFPKGLGIKLCKIYLVQKN